MPNPQKTRKMLFFEIGKGALLAEVQALFEEAQAEAWARKADCSLIVKINVSGPDDNQEERWGKCSFETRLRVPPKVSKDYTTELVDGVIVSSGESPADILQMALDLFPEEKKNVVPFEKETNSGT